MKRNALIRPFLIRFIGCQSLESISNTRPADGLRIDPCGTHAIRVHVRIQRRQSPWLHVIRYLECYTWTCFLVTLTISKA